MGQWNRHDGRRQTANHRARQGEEASDAEHYDATHAGEEPPEGTILETEMDVEDEGELEEDHKEEPGEEQVEKK